MSERRGLSWGYIWTVRSSSSMASNLVEDSAFDNAQWTAGTGKTSFYGKQCAASQDGVAGLAGQAGISGSTGSAWVANSSGRSTFRLAPLPSLAPLLSRDLSPLTGDSGPG